MAENNTPPFDRAKWTYELNRENAHRQHDATRELFHYINKASIEAGNIALKTLVVINGSAAITILTFLGGVAAKREIDFLKVANVASTIKWFAFGVALAVLAMALSYLTNYTMAGTIASKRATYEHPFIVDGPKFRTWRRWNILFHIAAVLVAFVSLGLFVYGMFLTSDAVRHPLASSEM
ncbi:hypothetical protein Nham_2131 [Nitrobacter hamburgensis X14]|uniref:Uncharacterized protein n=1 Tax=Nitrobacter hamburgensis (strain DSM 10229 / NCIMB 13809 / X14) TaxID=323097 RepID=Q1QLG9_NITHX|nr:hypothetical protein [Nitrobacter hamburgensis]ABE62928.1 hypothetical protein Nham_2131 [Nitrobacter hamburgensis X14]